MISHYQTHEAMALLERIGCDNIVRRRYVIVLSPANADHVETLAEDLTGHIVLCLLRNHLREWLERRAIRIETTFTGKSGCIATYYATKDLRNEDGYLEGDGGKAALVGGRWRKTDELTDGEWIDNFDDLDAALLAAAASEVE